MTLAGRTLARTTAPLALHLALLLAGCTPTHASGSPPPATGGSGGNPGGSYVGRPIPGEPGPGVAPTGPDPAGGHFTARTHEPHYAPTAMAPPVLLTLPRYVNGSAACFASPEYQPYYGYNHGQGSYGASQGAPSYGAGLGRSGGSHRYAVNPNQATAGAAPKSAAPSPSAAPAPAAADAWRGASEPQKRSQDSAVGLIGGGDRDRREAAPYSPPQPNWDGFGQPIYLSNDDTMSLSSAQRVIWAIERFAPIPREHVRPHELLNYFSFQTQPVASDHDFSVVANITELDQSQARLALSIQGRPVTRSSRRNVNLAYVVDRSGSMAAEGRMEYLKQGLLRSLDELKHGDIVHVTLFDTGVCQLAENFVVGRDNLAELRSSIARIAPEGSTNLHDGLTRGYEAADRAYQPGYSNRVVMITDAEANTGITDEAMIATVGQHYDARRIRLSGIGVGTTFNDSLLDQLTERGRGAYVFLGSAAEVDAVFGNRFVSLVETIAGDVHFRLHLPPSLAMATFYGEEASVHKERVQSVHYFANTAQLFLSDLKLRGSSLALQDDLMLSVEYEDPESGKARVEEFAWRIGDVSGRAPNLDKASYVDAFSRTVQALADRPLPSYSEQRYGWADDQAGTECRQQKAAASFFAGPIQADPELRRIEQLWDTFCSRYPVAAVPPVTPRPIPYRAPNPERHNDFTPPDSWPGATSRR